jgi:antitoxin component of MazEF toxin-antitoxin module
MQTMIVKWGNSQGIRIPKAFFQNKTNAKKHKTTKERLLEFYGEDFEQNRMAPTEIDWGKTSGNEIW